MLRRNLLRRRAGLNRSGFTLVELLVVIAIIGMLMAMVSVAIWAALKAAKQAKIIMEIDQLHQAMQAYKEKHLQYPPCLAESNLTARRVHFMRHLQVAFTNANYGTAEGNFNTVRNGLMNASGGITAQPYNYKNAQGDIRPLDLYTLDQAEAIVFWLGGFPTPFNSSNQSSIANRRIFGFHRDQDQPMKRDTLQAEGADPMRYRTELFYQFDETRLVDLDGDGWYEYSPLPSSSNGASAPYVYFDADSYSVSSSATGTALNINLLGYPRSGETGAVDLASQWGLAVPMAAYVDPTNTSPMLWQNPENFQIICGGLDGQYSAGVDGDLARAYRVPVFPKGLVYDKESNYTQVGSYTSPELDNLNNLSKETLDAAQQDAGR